MTNSSFSVEAPISSHQSTDSYPTRLGRFLHNKLEQLGWFKFGRQLVWANINWVHEFYAHNPVGENTFVYVRSFPIPTNATAINIVITRSTGNEDFDAIKDQLCEPNKIWNNGKHPHTINRHNLLPETKLCNTFVKRDIMLTSHNTTVDRPRL
ncbi:hypothetical protein GQ457_01G017050 [Hibiscus cannabinus]